MKMKPMVKGIRAWARDIAFPFRMGAGFSGDVNRTHPAEIEPAQIDVSAPPTIYGEPVLVSAANAGVRPFAVGDAAVTKIFGVTVRPYPTQQASATNFGATGVGAATPPTSGVIDVLRAGLIMVKIPAGQVVAKGGAVFIRVQNAAADKPIGGFEGAADGGNTAALDTYLYQFNGPADAAGVAELSCNV